MGEIFVHHPNNVRLYFALKNWKIKKNTKYCDSQVSIRLTRWYVEQIFVQDKELKLVIRILI